MANTDWNIGTINDLLIGKIRENLAYAFFLFALAMFYIWNNHKANALVREINNKGKQLKELRWEYMTTKSELMYKSKLTEIIPIVEPMGLKELKEPPIKIKLNSKDYQHQE